MTPRALHRSDAPILTWRATAWRSRLVLVAIWGALAAVVVKAFLLQHVQVDEWQRRAETRYERLRDIPAARGRLLDRHGTVVAMSIPEMRLGVVPKLLPADHPKLTKLAQILGMSEPALKRRLRQADRFFYLSKDLDLGAAEQVRALRLPGLELEQDYRRHYPLGETFSNLVGFTDGSDQGQEGIERAFNARLRGAPGTERVMVDRRDQAISQKRINEAKPGTDVRLSIDASLQSIAHRAVKDALAEHRARGAAAVVIDARNGELLALVNAPSFDPLQRARIDAGRIRNRAVLDSFEPGSTLKPFAIAAALDAGKVKPSTIYDTSAGQMTISGRTIRDSHRHERLTLSEVLEKSSNIGTAQVALMLPAQTLHASLRQAGFGQSAGLPIAAATAGRLRPWQSWVPIDQATISYGHGIAVSLVQLARAYTVFAGDGRLLPLSLEPQPSIPTGERVYSEATALAVRGMLERAAGPLGTAPKAQIDGFKVAGKTGTAHKPERGGYARNRYIASFAGFVPADQPRLIIAVMVDEPSAGRHYGGEVAAPIFAQIASESLRRLQMSPDPSVRVVPSSRLLGEGT
ncbi:MAG: cell division FtsI protein/penicillin-binding protein [Pseudomonadota bacterium]|jgi:cell division protein FtsI (penicillin-binding protein 3)